MATYNQEQLDSIFDEMMRQRAEQAASQQQPVPVESVQSAAINQPPEIVRTALIEVAPKPNRVHSPNFLRKFGRYVLAPAVSIAAVIGGVMLIESAISGRTEVIRIGQAADETSNLNDTAPAETVITSMVPEQISTTSTVAAEATVTSEVTTTTEQVPVLSLSQQIAAGEVAIGDYSGMPLGVLRLDKYCDDIQFYIANPIDLSTPEIITANMTSFSPEAKILAQYLLDHPHLSGAERFSIEEAIRENGLSNYQGDPMYYTLPATPVDPNCIPTAPNPRANQNAYGSPAVNARGGKAIQYQAIADVTKFGSIPGEGIAYATIHRSSGNAGGNSFNPELKDGYKIGDTATYSVDGKSIRYTLIEILPIDSNQSIPAFIEDLKKRSNGHNYLVMQVCVDGENDSRNLYIFDEL